MKDKLIQFGLAVLANLVALAIYASIMYSIYLVVW